MANEDKKDFNAMLHDSKDMPKFQTITDQKSIEKYGGSRMYFAPPIDYDKVMKLIPYGKVITVGKIREYFASLDIHHRADAAVVVFKPGIVQPGWSCAFGEIFHSFFSFRLQKINGVSAQRAKLPPGERHCSLRLSYHSGHRFTRQKKFRFLPISLFYLPKFRKKRRLGASKQSGI